ncbi:MAG: GntR family transcriptional regulator [Deltaproteobacteria bacterium]|nr:GntR family transcriptional regulator [Deltaproteobacteria bacterium]
MMLNSQSPMPLYHQLADILLAGIRAGDYPPDTRIPSEHSLAAAYGIGRPTVRQAIDLLVRKRILVRKRGSGTYVLTRQKEINLFSLAGTTSAFHREGTSVILHILQKTRLRAIGSDPENPFSGQSAYFLSRLTRVETSPVLIEDIYLHAGIFTGIDAIDLEGQSLSRIVDERYFMRPVSGRQTFRIGYVEGSKAVDLAVSSTTPILLVKRFLHFPQAENVIYSELYCRTDQFVFSQTIGGMTDD